MYYDPVKVTIDALGLAKVILDVIVWHYGLYDSIVSDKSSLFTLKFWSSLCYFLGIKRRLSTAFYPQTDGQTKRQNSMIEAYLRVFVNFEQNNWARLLLIAEFVYNNAKNTSTNHTHFELNCSYHPRMSYEEEVDPCSKYKLANKLSAELRELMIVCQENLYHAQKFQKRAHDKGVKPKSYTSVEKVWLNSNYIKTKQNQKLEAKFFGPFRVLHPVGKQTYKLELPRRWKIHDVFYVPLLEQDTTKKRRVDKEVRQMEFDIGDNNCRKYEVEVIWDSAVYAKESESNHLPGLYYLVACKEYLKEENIWKPVSAIQHPKKLINLFHKDYSIKPIATSSTINTIPPIARLTVKPIEPTKQKREQPANITNKRAKKNRVTFNFYRVFNRIWITFTLNILNCIARDCTWLHMTSSQP